MSQQSLGGAESAASEQRQPVREATGESFHVEARRIVILAVLFAFPACLAITSLAFGQNNPDLWWHLRTGAWIAQHHNVPWTDPFSSFGRGKEWLAYSWLYELAIYGFYRWLGLVGPAACVLALAAANGVALYQAVRRRAAGFAAPIALAGLGMLVLARFYTAMPVLVSVLFFTVETDILFGYLVGQSKEFSPRRLWLLPPLFALWANIHVEFFYGIAVLLFAALVERINLVSAPPGLRIVTERNQRGRTLWLVAGLSVVATLANPYTWRVYHVVLEYASDQAPFRLVTELNAPTFRSPLDYILMFTVLSAAFVLGRAQFRGKLFAAMLLAGCTIVSFRAAHDEFAVLIVSLLIIAESLRHAGPSVALNRRQQLIAVILALLFVVLWGRRQHLSNLHLEQDAEKDFPVKAAQFVLRKNVAGPLFNGFNWGGYLIWELPNFRVAMDGRTNLYGGARTRRNIATWSCQPGWKDDPDLEAANLVIGNVRAPLSYALQFDPDFEPLYRDKTAAVFVRRPQSGVTKNNEPDGNSVHTR